MDGFKKLIEQFRESLKFENVVLTQIEKAYMELVKILPKEERMGVKIKDMVKSTQSDETDIVKVNVGGSILYTLRSTLTRKIKKENGDEYYGTHLLQGLFDESETNMSQIPFIDRDSTYFDIILDYLRDPNEELFLPEDEFILKKIQREAKYFRLDGLVKNTENLLLNYSSINKSLIINTNEVKDLIRLCGFHDQQRFKLLYRATIDGFSAHSFHKKCDGQSNTLTIIKSTYGNIFGGFTTKPWSSNGQYVDDPDAFVFSLINCQGKPKKFDCVHVKHAIYCLSDCGPTFGSGHDIKICSDSNMIPSSFCNFFNSYYNDELNLSYGTAEAKAFLAGAHNFLTTEIEVFLKT